MRAIPLATALLTLAAAGSASAQRAPAETARPNAPDQRPAFPGQTRAPQPAASTRVDVAAVATGLKHPWALEFLPDGRMLVTEKAGALRIVSPDGRIGEPIAGMPPVDDGGQGGLLDVALSPAFAQDRTVFFSYSEPRTGGNGTSVARARLVESGAGGRLEALAVIFRQMPTYDGSLHFGSRLVFAPDGTLFVTVGERSDRGPRVQAQDLGSGLGKIFRINPDGTVPAGNPFVKREGALPEIWSYGHRNMQSAALDRQGRLWTVEHGPRGGDELNRPEAGKNYGWPEVSYGVEYSGQKLGPGLTRKAGTEQPVYYWDPVIAPSGMALYDGALFPGWRDAFLVGGLRSEVVVVLRLDGDRVATEERITLGDRIRDVKVGPDGAVYALTDDRNGRILKLTPGK